MNTLSVESMTETINKAFPFSVDKFRLYGPDNISTPHFGLFRSDNGKCVGRTVTSKYEPHTVDDICALAESASKAFGGAGHVQAHWNDGHYLTVSPSKDKQRSLFEDRYPGAYMNRKSDVVIPRLIIRAGYDGRAFSATFGMYRLVCKNLLAVPVDGQIIGSSIRHSSHLRSRIDDLVQNFQSIVNEENSIIQSIENANSKTVNIRDFIEEIYPTPAAPSVLVMNRHVERVECIIARMHRERSNLGLSMKGNNATAWEAFNAVQGYIQHETRKNKNSGGFDRAIASLSDSKVVKARELAFS